MPTLQHRSLRGLLLSNAILLLAAPAIAADVTAERLADRQPGELAHEGHTQRDHHHLTAQQINKRQ